MFTQTNEAVAWQMIRRQRSELYNYLTTLTAEEWDAQSLCDGWRVRDVVAHLILEYRYRMPQVLTGLVRARLDVNTFLKRTAIECGNSDPADLLAHFHVLIAKQHKPNGVHVCNVLADLLVHEQDIRIPLGQPRIIDADLLKLIFTHWEPGQPNIGERITGLAKRLHGLRFDITDLQIQKGEGHVVSGTAQDVLLAAVGRTVSVDNLYGSGTSILKNRVHRN